MEAPFDWVSQENKRGAVLTLLVKGINNLSSLSYFSDLQIAGWTVSDPVMVILQGSRVIASGLAEAEERMTRKRLLEAAEMKESGSSRAADTAADELEPMNIKARRTTLECALLRHGLEGLGRTLGPHQALLRFKGR